MSNKSNRNRRRKAAKAISKAAEETTSSSSTNRVGGLPKRGIGTAGIGYYQDLIDRLQPYELRWPQSNRTFEAMMNDDAVSSVLTLNYVLIETAFSRYKIKYNSASEKSKEAAKFLEWSLNNMDGQTLEQVIRDIETYKQFGFSILEKIYKKVPEGEYKGLWKISNLANRPQGSLDTSTPFEVSSGGRRLAAVRQDTKFFQNYFNNNFFVEPSDMKGSGYKRIPRKKFILFGEGATDTRPFGVPLLRSCYKLWKEKVLLEDLEVNGASKDLAGIIDLSIPSEILEKAQSNPESPEGQMVEDLLTTAANVHAGEQPYFVRPSDIQEGSSSMTEYGIKLLGLEGSGRQFNPSEMIQQRRKAIFDIWGAGHTLTGEGSVSYNSAEVKNSIHLHYIKRDLHVIESGLNKDLVPQLLNQMNGFALSYEDMPRIIAGDIEKVNLEEASKMVQRLISVNGLVPTKNNILYYHELLGFDTEEMSHMTKEELLTLMEKKSKGVSRAGEGQGTSGTGSTPQDNSDDNVENTG